MVVAARLVEVHLPRHPEAAVLVLHGGGSRVAEQPVSPSQLSVLRMVPLARRLARIDRKRLAVFRLLNSVRGWDQQHTPVGDVDWALDRIADRLGSMPMGLVGHSLGGRAALLAADRSPVASVVALNPWVYPDDGYVDAPDAQVLIVQGSADRIAAPKRSAAVAVTLRPRVRSLAYVQVNGGKHAMLSRAGVFGSLAADFTGAVLFDNPPRSSARIADLLDDRDEPVSR